MADEIESGEVDQEQQAQSFFVDQDTGERVDSTPSAEEAQEKPLEAEAAKEPDAKEAPTDTTEKENVEDPFNFMDTAEDGSKSFNALSAMEFLEGAGQKQPTYGEASPRAAEAAQNADPLNPQGAAQEPERSLVELARDNVMSFPNYMQGYIDQGYSIDQAYQYAKQAVENDLTSFETTNRYEEMEKRLEEKFSGKQTERTHQEEMAALTPVSTRNLHEVAKASGLGSVEKLQSALVNPEYGGRAIQHFFQQSIGDTKFESTEAEQQAMNDWFVKFTADRNNLELLADITTARIFKANLPKLTEAIRAGKVGLDNENKRGNGMGNISTQGKTRNNPATQKTNELANFLHVNSLDEV